MTTKLKLGFLALGCTLSLSAWAQTSSTSTDLLTTLNEQAFDIKDTIDDACGDTWCEGVEYNFTRFRCQASEQEGKASCSLTYWSYEIPNEITVQSYAKDGLTAQYQSGWSLHGTCTFDGISSIDDLIEKRVYGMGLSGSFYDKLSVCFSENLDSHLKTAKH